MWLNRYQHRWVVLGQVLVKVQGQAKRRTFMRRIKL